MLNFKTKKIASIVSAIAIMTACSATAFAASNGPSVTATNAVPDFSSIQEGGELVTIGEIDPESVNGSTATAAQSTNVAGVASVVAAGVDVSDIDFSTLYEGELVPIGEIDPSAFAGSTTTAAN